MPRAAARSVRSPSVSKGSASFPLSTTTEKIPPSPSASSAGLTSRTLRFLLIELTLSLFGSNAMTSQSSLRRRREILPLRIFCGLSFAAFAGLASRTLRFLPIEDAFVLSFHFPHWLLRKGRKDIRKGLKDVAARFFFPFASSAGFTSRPSRVSLRDLRVFCQTKPHPLSGIFHVGLNAKNANTFAKFAKTLPRDSFSLRPLRPFLRVLRGLHFANFAFSANRRRIFLSFHFPHWS